ncbi:nitronate monooxygenase [Aliamphritea spongicola]|nr:nitronate monooxygenase [Aliamphritea spongicola]
MPGFSGPELAAAVSDAGGLGHIGGCFSQAEDVRLAIEQVRRLTAKPFGVYLIPQHSDHTTFRTCLKEVIKERPQILTLCYGYYGDAIRKARAAGICVAVQVRSQAEARMALRDGAQILIAQGEEAAGYIPGQIGLMALLPELIALAGDVPVMAAGSVHDCHSVRGLMAMGAAGVWCTAGFAVCHESSAGKKVKQRLLSAETGSERLCCEPVPDVEQQAPSPHKTLRQNSLLRRFLSSSAEKIIRISIPYAFTGGRGLDR